MHVCKIWDNDLTEYEVWYKLFKMITTFWVYIWGYQLDVRFGSLLGCLQIIFL